jgi:hypothetical protein
MTADLDITPQQHTHRRANSKSQMLGQIELLPDKKQAYLKMINFITHCFLCEQFKGRRRR